MKIVALLVALALLLVACAAPTAEHTTTIEESTTEYITTAQEPTTVFEPRYLSETEIDEIFGTAWQAIGHFFAPLYDSRSPIEINGRTWFQVTNFESINDIATFLHDYLSPQATQDFMGLRPNSYLEHEGNLYFAGSNLGGVRHDRIRIVTQTDAAITYHIYRLEYIGSGNHVPSNAPPCIYTRELIDGRWVFTTFPFYW
ncbi:MAG: hypothetical protein FWE40_07805 [Oscillospiraceae bacterium]|nr:hypothetical protein [Oscillospiraceae bacterium]